MLLFKAARKDPTLSPVLTASQKRIMRILGDAMRQVRATTEREEGKILDAILHGPTTRVTALIPTEPWLEAQALIEEELAAELVAAGHRYGRQVPALRKAVVDFRFDVSRPEAASWAAKHAGQLIVQIMQHQQTIVQDYVSRASMGEMAPREVAAGLRNVIGLTNEQAGWVQNFEARQLAAIDGVPTKRDLDRVAAATSRYHDRVHRYRTENIARTEILSASHEGRRQAWAQGLQEGYISPTAMQEWSAEMDGRVCPICSAMDGQKVPIGEEFPQGEPPIHPSCRCDVLLLDAAPVGPWDEMSDEELDAQLESLLSGGTVEEPPTEAQRWGATEETLSRNLSRKQAERFADGDYTVIDEWVSGDYVIDVQESMRFAGGRLDEVPPDVKKKVLDLADRSIRLDDDATLYRVVPRDALPDDLVVDGLVWDDAFATTVVRKADYEEFLSYGGPLGGGDSTFTIEIRAAAGTEGVWASPAGIGTDVASFEEFILMPGQKMKILEVLADKIIVGIGV